MSPRRPVLAVAIAVVATAVALAAGGGAPAALAGAHTDAAYFETPSRNIACGWFADLDRPARTYLRCEIRSLLRPMPPRPASCDVDWGYGMTLANTGGASVLCAGDTVRRANTRSILAYGATWRRRGFTCRSASTGLTCRNTSGHGFFLSRESWRRF